MARRGRVAVPLALGRRVFALVSGRVRRLGRLVPGIGAFRLVRGRLRGVFVRVLVGVFVAVLVGVGEIAVLVAVGDEPIVPPPKLSRTALFESYINNPM